MSICANCRAGFGIFGGLENYYKGKILCDNCYLDIKVDIHKKSHENHKFYKEKYQVPSDLLKVFYLRGFLKMTYKSHFFIWLRDEMLWFFPTTARTNESQYEEFKIPLAEIEYFAQRQSVEWETKIHGGGGKVGGSSLTGAVIGGAIAGGAGAVIGSRKSGEIKPIKSEKFRKDKSETYMNVFVGHTRRSLFFNYDDYEALNQLIPAKAYGYNMNRIRQEDNSKVIHNNSKDIIELLKELSALKDAGIISEEEFENKKKILLDKIQ